MKTPTRITILALWSLVTSILAAEVAKVAPIENLAAATADSAAATCNGPDDNTCKVRIVTEEELASKTGDDGGTELWLSIFGQVYDVSKGPQYYAPKSGYHIFAGKDGTIPFITGNFTAEECKKSSDELSDAQLFALDREWAKFYDKEEKYPFVGFLCCRFYDDQGRPTEETLRIKERVKGYEKIKVARDKERQENRRKMQMSMAAVMALPM